MNEWFETEQIDADTYCISEYRHREQTHCWLLCGTDRAFLIDTGTGIRDIGPAVRKLYQGPVTVLTTHVHWDHIGSHGSFEHFGVHEAEVPWISEHFPVPRPAVLSDLIKEPTVLPDDFDPETWNVFQGIPSFTYAGGETLSTGNRNLQIIHTPGHSPGHCVFYEAERGYLFSGDLIYYGQIDAFYPSTDPVKLAESIRKLKNLKIGSIFPGHYRYPVHPGIIGEMTEALKQIEAEGDLRQCGKTFDFGTFSFRF